MSRLCQSREPQTDAPCIFLEDVQHDVHQGRTLVPTGSAPSPTWSWGGIPGNRATHFTNRLSWKEETAQ